MQYGIKIMVAEPGYLDSPISHVDPIQCSTRTLTCEAVTEDELDAAAEFLCRQVRAALAGMVHR